MVENDNRMPLLFCVDSLVFEYIAPSTYLMVCSKLNLILHENFLARVDCIVLKYINFSNKKNMAVLTSYRYHENIHM